MTPTSPRDLLSEEQLAELALVRRAMIEHAKDIERDPPKYEEPLSA